MLLPPHEKLFRLVAGGWVSQMLYVAAHLELADRLSKQPRPISELARETNTHEPSLYRLLRGLASVGVFAETEGRTFRLTEMAEYIRTDHPQSMRRAILMSGSTQHYWSELLHSVTTGEIGFERNRGKSWFDHLGENQQDGAAFDQMMVSIHGAETTAIAISYDFNAFNEIVDVGGGNGSHLRGILRLHRKPKGIVFDLPHVVERTEKYLASHRMSHRCRTVGGSFFEAVPAGADAYLLRHILHDWDEEQSLLILRAIRNAIPAHGKLLVIESVIYPGNAPALVKLLDLAMLVFLGGQERSEADYRELLAKGGFQLARIIPAAAEVDILEAVPV
jgi:hypothetical protein